MSSSRFPSNHSVRKGFKGAVAGFIATVPMTIFMLIGWRFLPRREKYPLPPRLITEEITERLGIEDEMSEEQLVAATLASHFGYGALFGAIYSTFDKKLPIHPSFKGALTGLAIWVGSYLGWLPALGILRSAIRHPWQRNLLMIVAHLVWGVTLGEVMHKLNSRD
jgi:uncharacterized membrane protein YagU involved in acid resistance